MRLVTLFSLLVMSLLPMVPAAASDDFAGAWTASICPKDQQAGSGNCSTFVLELHQKDGQLCGTHLFSTAGAAQIDEGAAPSLAGNLEGEEAEIIITSTRSASPVRVRGELKMVNGALRWQRLDNPPGDYLLPRSARLTKSKRKTFFAPVFEQELKAACSSAFTLAAQRKAQQAQPEVPGTSGSGAPAQAAPAGTPGVQVAPAAPVPPATPGSGAPNPRQ